MNGSLQFFRRFHNREETLKNQDQSCSKEKLGHGTISLHHEKRDLGEIESLPEATPSSPFWKRSKGLITPNGGIPARVWTLCRSCKAHHIHHREEQQQNGIWEIEETTWRMPAMLIEPLGVTLPSLPEASIWFQGKKALAHGSQGSVPGQKLMLSHCAPECTLTVAKETERERTRVNIVGICSG